MVVISCSKLKTKQKTQTKFLYQHKWSGFIIVVKFELSCYSIAISWLGLNKKRHFLLLLINTTYNIASHLKSDFHTLSLKYRQPFTNRSTTFFKNITSQPLLEHAILDYLLPHMTLKLTYGTLDSILVVIIICQKYLKELLPPWLKEDISDIV